MTDQERAFQAGFDAGFNAARGGAKDHDAAFRTYVASLSEQQVDDEVERILSLSPEQLWAETTPEEARKARLFKLALSEAVSSVPATVIGEHHND